MAYADIKELATGQVYTGKQAKDLGLVDELGSKNEVKAYLEKELNTSVEFVYYKKPKTFIQSLTESISEQSYHIGEGIGSKILSKSDEGILKV